MGKIYYVMGKSASGKDTIYNKLYESCPKMKKVIIYTTRPKREDEKEGVEYHFVSEEKLMEFERANKLIEKRVYHTVHGPWSYATVDDGQIKLGHRNYLIIGTLESYLKILDYFGKDQVYPIYIQLDPGIRLQRALNRENMQSEPKYAEMCRRFLADEHDFSEEKLKEAEIEKRYINEDLHKCLEEIKADIEPV
ncbi:MAG: guanylate kinase [Johnsonella sp.]|nr:guanylate kinase [Johnsonella sp.]